jgi:tetratricopeptide (TPR) repeat protein
MVLFLALSLPASARPLWVEPLPIPVYNPEFPDIEEPWEDYEEALPEPQRTLFEAFLAESAPDAYKSARESVELALDTGNTAVWIAWARLQSQQGALDFEATRARFEAGEPGQPLSCDGLKAKVRKACKKWRTDAHTLDDFLGTLDEHADDLDVDGRLLRASLHKQANADEQQLLPLYEAVDAAPGSDQEAWVNLATVPMLHGPLMWKVGPKLADLLLAGLPPEQHRWVQLMVIEMGGPPFPPPLGPLFSALDTAKDRAETPLERASALYMTSVFASEFGENKRAINAFTEIAALDEPSDLSATANLTLAMRPDGSADHWARVEEVGGPELAALGSLGLGWMALRAGRTAEAREKAEKAQEHGPADDVQTLMNWVLLAEGSALLGVEEVEEVAKVNSGYVTRACGTQAQLRSPKLRGTVMITAEEGGRVLTPDLDPKSAAAGLIGCLERWLPADQAPPYSYKLEIKPLSTP